ERDRAMGARRLAQEIERRPAGKAELAVVADDDAAAGTTRGQRIVDDRARRRAQTGEPCPRRSARSFGIPRRPCHRRVVPYRPRRHKRRMSQAPRPLFSSARHRAQRDRMARLPPAANFLAPIIAETLLDRLTLVTREFRRTLLVGAHDAALIDQLRATGTGLTSIEAAPRLADRTAAIAVEADAVDLPFGSFDLILWPGGLDSVNDVPGALVRLHALLAPDGLLLGAFVGDGSLPRLRRAVMADGVRSIARLHPQIDL